MVEEVTAFAAGDGSLHKDKIEAAKQDARLSLKKMDIFHEGTICAMLSRPQEIIDALTPVAWELEAIAAAQTKAKE